MWRKATKDDLIATLSQSEVDAFAQDSDWQSEPVENLLNRTAEFVRSFLRRNTSVKMCPVAGTLPEGLISPAMDYAAFDVLKRHDVAIGEDRRNARRDALELFEKVAANEITPESYLEEGEKTSELNEIASTPAAGKAIPFRLLD